MKGILTDCRIFGEREMGIKKRMMLIVFSTGMITLLLACLIAAYGILGMRTIAEESGRDIGQKAEDHSTLVLTEAKERELTNLTKDRADDINHRLGEIKHNTELLANAATEMMAHPDKFTPLSVIYPEECQGGRINSYLQYCLPTFRRQNHEEEIIRSSPFQNIAERVIEYNPMISEITLASKSGFAILTEDERDISPKEYRPASLFFNHYDIDWYIAATNAGKTVFSEVRANADDNMDNFVLHFSTPYYDANGEMAGVVCSEMYLEKIIKIVENADIEQSGACFVIDSLGRIILSSEDDDTADDIKEFAANTDDLRQHSNQELADLAQAMVRGENGIRKIKLGEDFHYIAFAPIPRTGWSFVATAEEDAVLEPVKENGRIIRQMAAEDIVEMNGHIRETFLFMMVFVILLLLTVVYVGRRLSEHFVEPIHKLAAGVREIASGNLSKTLDIKTGDEIEHLATCFNAMTSELQTYMKNLTEVTAEKERIATELDLATGIQEGMLPRLFPVFPEHEEFDLYASMTPAKEVGGDFYDFYLLDENHLVITVADVSGKGVPAALFMVISKTVLKNSVLTMDGYDLGKVVDHVNSELIENNEEFMFVTAFVGILELDTGRFLYVNAGHNAPLLYRADEKKFAYFPAKENTVLGIKPGNHYQSREISVAAGDIIYLYTDGVTEALSESDELYGEERLLTVLNQADAESASAKGLSAFVKKSLDEYVGNAEQSDDITMLTLVFRGENVLQRSEEGN